MDLIEIPAADLRLQVLPGPFHADERDPGFEDDLFPVPRGKLGKESQVLAFKTRPAPAGAHPAGPSLTIASQAGPAPQGGIRCMTSQHPCGGHPFPVAVTFDIFSLPPP